MILAGKEGRKAAVSMCARAHVSHKRIFRNLHIKLFPVSMNISHHFNNENDTLGSIFVSIKRRWLQQRARELAARGHSCSGSCPLIAAGLSTVATRGDRGHSLSLSCGCVRTGRRSRGRNDLGLRERKKELRSMAGLSLQPLLKHHSEKRSHHGPGCLKGTP